MPEKATTLSNVFGTIGTVLWCIQLVPQIIHNYRRKNCEGLPPLMLLLWAMSGVPFAIYFIVQNANIPVQVQPHVFLTLSLITWYQSLIYPPISMNKKKASLYFVVLMAIFAGIEAGCVFPFISLYKKHITWPTTLFGVIAAVLLGVGLLPPYWELYKRQGRVVGLNFIFLAIDTSGAVFSLLSLVTQNGTLDILGCILYIVIMVLEGGLYVSQIIWLIRTRGGKVPLKQRRNTNDTLTNNGDVDVDEEESKKDEEALIDSMSLTDHPTAVDRAHNILPAVDNFDAPELTDSAEKQDH